MFFNTLDSELGAIGTELWDSLVGALSFGGTVAEPPTYSGGKALTYLLGAICCYKLFTVPIFPAS